MVITSIDVVFTVTALLIIAIAAACTASSIRSLLPNYPDSSALFFSCEFWVMKSISLAFSTAACVEACLKIVLMQAD